MPVVAADGPALGSSGSAPFMAVHQILAMPSYLSHTAPTLPQLVDDDDSINDGPQPPAPALDEVHQSNINFFNLPQLLQPSPARRDQTSSSTQTTSSSTSPSSSSATPSNTTTTAATGGPRPGLFVATFYGNDRDVVALLQAGADPNQTDKHGWTPLALAASRGDKKVTWVLLNWNKVKGGPLADPNIRDNEGCTALHRAAFVQNEDIMKMLIAAGADVNVHDDNGETPLHLAAERDNAYLISHLLQAGAEIDARDRDERTALHFAAIAGGEEACHALIRRGADPHAQDVDRETPLHAACEHNQNVVARALVLGYQVAVNAQSKQRKTPLHLAAARDNYDLCELLLENGANVNARMRNGRTPLHYAAAKGFVRVTALLLRHGANTEIRDARGKGKTAAEWAAIKGHLEVEALFSATNAAPEVEERSDDDDEEGTTSIAGMRRTGTAQAIDVEEPGVRAAEEEVDQQDWRYWRLPVDSVVSDHEADL